MVRCTKTTTVNKGDIHMSDMPGFSRTPMSKGNNVVVAKSNERTPDPERVELLKKLDTMQQDIDTLYKKFAELDEKIAKLK